MNIESFRISMTVRKARVLGLCIVAALHGACASVDLDYPKQATTAIPAAGDTTLGQQVSAHSAEHPGESGFLLLGDGIEALASRLVMVRRAERTLDAQYYLITDDDVG
jgi:putative cardiolipin synthase